MPLAIYLELERMGFKVWYDNRADDLTKEGMLQGIEQAAAFILVSGLAQYLSSFALIDMLLWFP